MLRGYAQQSDSATSGTGMMLDTYELPLLRLMQRLEIDTDRLTVKFEPLMIDAARRCAQCNCSIRCNVLLDREAPVRLILQICPNSRMLEVISPLPDPIY